jgi:GntR family transcriptional regulator
MQSFSMWAVSQGHTPSARVLRCEPGAATDQEAGLLRVPPGESLVRLERLRLLDGEPTMVERTLYTGVVAELLLAMDLTSGSITEQLTARGHVYAHAEHSIDAVAAGAGRRGAVGRAPGQPAAAHAKADDLAHGAPLEWSDDRYRQDAVTITVRNSMSANTLARLSGRGSGNGSGSRG